MLAGYRRFHEVFEYTLETNDTSHIGEAATGTQARHLELTVRMQRHRGIVRRLHDVVNPRIARVAGDTAIVLDCVLSNGLWTYRVRTGARVGPAPKPVRSRLRAMLVQVGGTWKVADIWIPRDPRC